MNYISSYQLLQYPDVDIILLENYPCNNKQELHARERHYIELLDCVNKCIPTRTPKEAHQAYYQENRERVQSQQQQYAEEHQEEIKDWQKQYYQDNKAQIKVQRKAC